MKNKHKTKKKQTISNSHCSPFLVVVCASELPEDRPWPLSAAVGLASPLRQHFPNNAWNLDEVFRCLPPSGHIYAIIFTII